MSLKKGFLFLCFTTLILTFPLLTSVTEMTTQCTEKATSTAKDFQKAFSKDTTNQIIDSLTDLMIKLPQTLQACFGTKVSAEFTNILPPICIHDMGKAAKLVSRMSNQMDNNFKLSMDTAEFQLLYHSKLKKQCPLLEGTTLNQIKSGGVCLEASYKYSLVFEQLINDIKAGSKTAAYKDIDTLATTLPDVLDACGQSKLANQVRKFLAMNCVHAVQDFAGEMIKVEENYMHLEWLAKHYKEIFESLNKVRKNCPIV